MLTLRDLQSSKAHAVPPGGMIIGREGGDADIRVRTASVSKKHARVYAVDGAWFIEDLRSANGTFVDNHKISEPSPLHPGVIFDLAGYRFEVADIVVEEPEPPEQEDDAGRTFTGIQPDPSEPPAPARPRLSPGGRPPPRLALDRTAAGKIPAKTAVATKPGMHTQAALGDDERESAPAEQPAPEEPPAAEPASEEQPAAEPAFEEPAEDQGFPERDADDATRERSVVAASADDLKGPKAAAGKVLSDLPKAIAYYLVAAPKLLFNPKGRVVPKIVLVLGALAILGTVFGALGGIKTAVTSIRTGAPAAASAPTDTSAKASAKASDDEAADEGSAEAKPLGTDIQKQVEQAQNVGAKALADGQKAAEAAAEAAKAAGGDGQKAAAEAAKEAIKNAAKEASEDRSKPAKEPEPEKAPSPSPTTESNAATEPSGEGTPYQRYATKRAFIEKAIASDPTLLRNGDTLKLYRQLHDKHRDIRRKIGGRGGIAADDLPSIRLVEAETFAQTGKLVDVLYARLRR